MHSQPASLSTTLSSLARGVISGRGVSAGAEHVSSFSRGMMASRPNAAPGSHTVCRKRLPELPGSESVRENSAERLTAAAASSSSELVLGAGVVPEEAERARLRVCGSRAWSSEENPPSAGGPPSAWTRSMKEGRPLAGRTGDWAGRGGARASRPSGIVSVAGRLSSELSKNQERYCQALRKLRR